jgi:hypothetical protein
MKISISMIILDRATLFCCFLIISSQEGEQTNLSGSTGFPQTTQCL